MKTMFLDEAARRLRYAFLRSKWWFLSIIEGEYFSSREYWEMRYASGGTSGDGSAGRLREFKARVLNEFVERNRARSVIEFGCGDGEQLELADYPEYLGIDVSRTAIQKCRERFEDDPSKRFIMLSDYDGEKADLSLTLDVVYHLTEEESFREHMENLFEASRRFVIVYSSNLSRPASARHVRHRKFTEWIERNRGDWRSIEVVPNEYQMEEVGVGGSVSDFYIYAHPDE